MAIINFKVSSEDRDLIQTIVERAHNEIYSKHPEIKQSRMDTSMDITACHTTACPLDLKAFAECQEFDFTHDVLGIRRHLNRATGQLEDFFVPRFALPQSSK